MLLDMCDCVGTGNDGEQRRQRVWVGVELVGGGRRGDESVEVCTRLHYPADLVMTAGAQEERSSRG